jgi:hypothetical protein
VLLSRVFKSAMASLLMLMVKGVIAWSGIADSF